MHESDAQIVETLQGLIQREGLALNLSGETKTTSNDGATVNGNTQIIEVARAAPLERVPGEGARSWVVTLSPLSREGQQGPKSNALGYNPQLISDSFAVIEWGSIGSSEWVVVDWSAGQQFSVYGSYVRVWGGITDFAGVGPVIADNRITRFSAHVTPGIAHRKPVRTILYGNAIAAAAEAEFSVPAYAREFSLSGTLPDVDLANLTVEGRMQVGLSIIWTIQPGVLSRDGGPVVTDPNYMQRVYRLPIGTNFLAVLLGGAGGPFVTPRVRYELSLS